MKFRIIIFFLPLLVMALLSCGVKPAASVGPGQISIIKGTGRLSSAALDSQSQFHLAGEYEYYPSKLFTPEDFRKGLSQPYREFIRIPRVKSFGGGEVETSPYGFATYRVILDLESDKQFAINPGLPMSAYRLWINGRHAGEMGKVGTSRQNSRPDRVPHLYDFSPRQGKVEVILQVANFHYISGGLIDPLRIGEKKWMHHHQLLEISFSLFLCGIFLIVGLYNFAIFIIRRKEAAAFWFGFFSFIVGIRVLLTNDAFISVIVPGFDWELSRTLEFLTVSLSLPAFVQFLGLLFAGSVNRFFLRFLWVAALLYSLLIIFTPARVFGSVLVFYHGLFLAAGFYCVIVFISAVIDKREGAGITFAGFIVLFFAVLNDILVANNLIPGLMLIQFGFIIFILSQSLHLISRFSLAFGRAEELSENLDRKVKERTRELEQERNRFKVRTETMERELTLARRIQEQLIPHPYPTGNISSMYKPMDQVGGDFYDFLKFRSSNKIGIFLSDVSGHGVPAAFITSMVKTLILQSGPRRENPAELLAFLNRLLINQTGGNFITALYGILDPETRLLEFSNAGHHAPIAVTGERVYPVNGARSIPLAVMDNEILEKSGKMFRNSHVTLEQDSKLVLYTDGLTETTSRDDMTVYFEDDVLYRTLHNLREFSSRKFVEGLISELIAFHGDDSFDDDICLICVDV